MRPCNLLMQDKLSQELSNERAALDWKHQQSQAVCGRQIRPSDAYDPFRLLLVVERFELNHFLQHSRWFPTTIFSLKPFQLNFCQFFLCSSANSSNSKLPCCSKEFCFILFCCSFSPNDTIACLSSSSCCFFKIIKLRFFSECVFDRAAV